MRAWLFSRKRYAVGAYHIDRVGLAGEVVVVAEYGEEASFGLEPA
jgi:hypothetical protein